MGGIEGRLRHKKRGYEGRARGGKGGGEAKASRTGESWIDRCAQMRSSREWASEWADEQGQAQALGLGLERRVGGRVSG